MKKLTKVVIVIGSVLTLIVAIAYYIRSVNYVNTQCMGSLDPLSHAIYQYRNAHGDWPENILAFSNDMKKTTRGVPITYDRTNLCLSAKCSHPGIPLFDRLDYRPGGANYSSCTSHGQRLDVGYERWQEEIDYERFSRKLENTGSENTGSNLTLILNACQT